MTDPTRRRLLPFWLTVGLLVVPTAVLAAEAEDYETPRTPWGDPDLQGIYSNTTLTPFERPPALGDKAFLTEEEVAEMEGGRAQMIDGAHSRPASETEAGGNIGAYNLHWMELGTRVVGSRRTSLVVDPPDGRVPVRPEAEERRAHDLARIADSYEYQSVWDRCITRGVPGGMFPAGYNNGYQILQTPDHVAILHEMIHDVRIIPINGRDHVDESFELWNGDSRGRWEGDTLIVETARFSDKGWIATSGSQGRIKGIPQTTGTRTVERLRRIDDGTVAWQVTIEDEDVYTAPWTVEIPLYSTDPPYQMFEYACHEGNWSVRNTLSGGRAEDAAATGGGV